MAIIIAAGRYGTGPGLAATIISVVMGTAFMTPEVPFRLSPDQITNIGLFLVASAAMLAFAAHLKTATERAMQLQAELQRAQTESAMGAMAATLAHELNQPLAAATNYLGACKRIGADLVPVQASKLIKGIGEAEAQIHRAGEIIRYARQMVTSKAAQREPLSLGAAVSRMMEALRASGNSENLRLRMRIDPEADAVWANPIQLDQVLLNLLRNACQASAGGGRSAIQVSGRVEDDVTVVEVRDGGAGIPKDRLKTLFLASGPSSSGGLGLGLSISRAIVEAHGGRIWAANDPGGGARFSFTIARAMDGR